MNPSLPLEGAGDSSSKTPRSRASVRLRRGPDGVWAYDPGRMSRPKPPPKILIVDDQAAVREELAYALRYEGYEPTEARDGDAALAAVEETAFQVVLLDIKMPGLDGMQVLSQLRKDHPELPVIMISGHGDIETAVVAVKQGATDFLPKPFDTDRVLVSVKAALRLRDLARQNAALRNQLAKEYEILGSSDAIQTVLSAIERVAPTEVFSRDAPYSKRPRVGRVVSRVGSQVRRYDVLCVVRWCVRCKNHERTRE